MPDNPFGLLLIVVGIILFMYSLPILSSSVNTATGTPLENESVTIKAFYNFMGREFISILGLILLAVGVAYSYEQFK